MQVPVVYRAYVLRGLLSENHCSCPRIFDGLSLLSPGMSGGRGFRYKSTWTSVPSLPSFRTAINVQYKRWSSAGNGFTGQIPQITGQQEKQLKKLKTEKRKSTVFYDSLRIFTKGGTGGHGLPKRGGIGGKGGDIVAVGHETVTLQKISALNPSRRFVAEPGADSKFFCLNGIPGKNTIIPVPLGVSIVTELGHKIGDINRAGEKLVIAKGGTGGNSSNGFSAEKGQSHNVMLDLKLIADVGFVGFPNAGKSTLLKGLSRASPKIASYPFTTVRPNVGVMEFSDYRQISLADLPGLVEGAHANIGMGHKFLKHVERTKLLLFIVDIHGFQLGPNYPLRSCMETIVLLNKELELYNDELTEKPAVLALNKSDLPGSYQIIKEVEKTVSDQSLYEKYLMSLPAELVPENVLLFDKIIPISAKTDPISVNTLKTVIREAIDANDSESALAVM